MKSSNPTESSTPPESLYTQSFQNQSPDATRSKPSSVKELASDAKRSAGNMINQAKERAASAAEEQKQSAAQHINRYGTALRDSARSVEQEDPNVAYFANQAAERIEKVANYVRSTDLTGMRRDAEDLARRHPALFMGGMLLAGLVVGGLIKASAQSAIEDSEFSDSDASNEYPTEEPDINVSQTAANI